MHLCTVLSSQHSHFCRCGPERFKSRLRRRTVFSLLPSGGQETASELPVPKQQKPAPKPHVSSSVVVMTIGTSRSNTKVASVPAGYTCPSRVDKTNWLSRSLTAGATGMATYPDWFQVSQNGTTLNVTRKDRKAGWPFELKFQCNAGSLQSCVVAISRFLFELLVLCFVLVEKTSEGENGRIETNWSVCNIHFDEAQVANFTMFRWRAGCTASACI